jgi:hypothetical protein
MRISQRSKNARDKTRRHSHLMAYERFVHRHGKNAIVSRQYWGTHVQWGDFSFIHPLYRFRVGVSVRTLTYAYNDKCEALAADALKDLPRPWLEAFTMDRFLPIYSVPKGSTRPRAKMFRMADVDPGLQESREAHYALERQTASDLANSGTVFVSCAREVSKQTYGWWIELVVDLPDLHEHHLPMLKSMALGEIPLGRENKTFSRAQVLTSFGYDPLTPDNQAIMQSLPVKI